MNNYAEVGRAVAEAQAIEEAFRAILRADFNVAQRCLARAQSEHYSLKPWKRGFPLVDALWQGIVYEENGGRYEVRELQENGSHVRLELGHRRYVGPATSFTVHAETLEEARLLASVYANKHALHEVREDHWAQLGGGQYTVRFTFGRMPL